MKADLQYSPVAHWKWIGYPCVLEERVCAKARDQLQEMNRMEHRRVCENNASLI